jgi:hypothetical protein
MALQRKSRKNARFMQPLSPRKLFKLAKPSNSGDCLKIIIAFCMLSILLAAGCVSTPGGEQPPAQAGSGQNKTCRTVVDEVPDVKEQCSNASFSEQSCSIRKLNYTATTLPRVDLCISDSPCMGKPLGECIGCAKAMSRCVLRVQSLETLKTGTWSVAANFSVGNSGFNKDPISHPIGPNQSADFDFSQIYTTDYSTGSASCSLAVVAEPTIEDCVQVTRMKTECHNVTGTKSVTRQVCE